MDCKNCKDCKYYESFYHGGINFSHNCLLALKDPKDVTTSECIKWKTVPKYTVTVSKNGFLFYAEMFTTRKQAETYVRLCKKFNYGKEYKFKITRNED